MGNKQRPRGCSRFTKPRCGQMWGWRSGWERLGAPQAAPNRRAKANALSRAPPPSVCGAACPQLALEPFAGAGAPLSRSWCCPCQTPASALLEPSRGCCRQNTAPEPGASTAVSPPRAWCPRGVCCILCASKLSEMGQVRALGVRTSIAPWVPAPKGARGGAGLGTGRRGAQPCSEDALRGLGHLCASWDTAAGRGLPFLGPLCTGIPVPAVPSPFLPGGGAEPRLSLGVSPWPPAACLPLAAAGCRAVLGQEPRPPRRAESSPPSCVLHPSGPRRGQHRSEQPVRNLVTILPLGENTAAKS